VNTDQTYYRVRHTPGLFWPIILIGIGIIWLLTNLGFLAVNPWLMLWRLWPVLLIVMGLDILLRRSGAWGALISAVMGLLVVAGAVVFLFAAQNNPAWLTSGPLWSGAPVFNFDGQLRTAQLADPLGGARRADVTIGFPGGDGSISALRDPANLLQGDVSYYGDLTHTVSKANDSVRVELASRSGESWPFFRAQPRWDLKLNAAPEYALQLNVGSGNCDFDLSQLNLTSLGLNHGSGSTRLDLPKSGQYRFALDMGSGSVEVRVPEELPVRVEYRVGSGSLNVSSMSRVSGDDRNGVYESSGFSQSGPYVIITVSLGSGSVTID
jgi:LiaF transmembrane domain